MGRFLLRHPSRVWTGDGDAGTHSGLKYRQSHRTHLRTEQRKHKETYFTSAKTEGKQDAGLVIEPHPEKGKTLLPAPSAHLAANQGNATGKPRSKPRGRALPRRAEGLLRQPGGFEGLWGSTCDRPAPAGIASRAAREKRQRRAPRLRARPPPGSARMGDCPGSLCLLGQRQERVGCSAGHSAPAQPRFVRV